MKDSIVRGAAVAVAIASAAAPATAAPRPESVAVKARVVLGFTNVDGAAFEAAGLVERRPFRRGAIEPRGRLEGRDATGRFTLFDGRGSLRGRVNTSTADGNLFTGKFTVEGGSGRYAAATGALRFRGAFDSTSVPAVTVLPGTLAGTLHVRPASPRPPLTKAVPIDLEGKGAKVRYRQVSPEVAKLTHARATAMRRLGKGVLIETDDVDPRTPLRPKVVTWYGADGTWTAKGTTSLDTGPKGSDPLKVAGGTGRYRGAHGSLAYTLLTDASAVSGLQVARLRGTLRFPRGG